MRGIRIVHMSGMESCVQEVEGCKCKIVLRTYGGGRLI